MPTNHRVHVNNDDVALDRRLELLESRFTTPAHVQRQQLDSSPDTATVLGSSLSPVGLSHHSFGFETKSSSRMSSGASNSDLSGSNMGRLIPKSKKEKRRKRMSSIDQVQQAAERQIQRVLAKASPSHSCHESQNSNSASNQTILTSHVASQEESNSKPRVVLESPPGLAAVSPGNATGGNRLRSVPTKTAPVTIDKRKSIPVKRPQPSVVDSSAPAKSSIGKNTTTTPSAPPRKRTRLNFTSSSDEAVATVAATAVATTSPKPLIEHSTNSRSNPGKPGKKKAVSNNAKINQFFSTVQKTAGVAVVQQQIPVAVTSAAPPVSKSSNTTSSATDESDMDVLRSRCQELEQQCHDMNSQLKAVSNNQTIMHTALQASLRQKEKELEQLKKSRQEDATKAAQVVERLIRVDSANEARELRQQLATDGARLGRITFTRAGMRAVETWEEGYASKLLARRKSDLEKKRQTLLDRKHQVEMAAKALKEGNEFVGDIGGMILNDALSVMEAQESIRLHLDNISAQEGNLREEEYALKKEKAEHIRGLKRVASEDASRFRGRPKLNDRYVLLSLLGKGGFSEVWRAFDLVDLQEVAVKIHQLDPRWSESKKDNYTKHVSREYEIHRDVRHPRIVSLYDVFEIDNNSFATVLEVCNGTDLDTLLKEKRQLPERDARAILLQILSGMNYLSHSSGNRQGIIHYDLKPGNILFDEFGDAKITDFGLSKIVDAPDAAESMELTSQGAGTYWYLPPECFITDHTVRISNKVDVWSIGVIYYQMLFGKRPFGDGMSQDRVLTDNTMLNAHEVSFPDLPCDISSEGREFIRQCLTYDQAFRPTIGQICKSSYILEKKF